jgi:hypothetical protein
MNNIPPNEEIENFLKKFIKQLLNEPNYAKKLL